jgi:hypothetical protein
MQVYKNSISLLTSFPCLSGKYYSNSRGISHSFTSGFSLYEEACSPTNSLHDSTKVFFSFLRLNNGALYEALIIPDSSVVFHGVTLYSLVTAPPLVITMTLGSSLRGSIDISWTFWFPPRLS